MKNDHKLLLNWFKQNKRSLPWRVDKNPYFVWISEVMLQQTTVVAVVPYYTKFLLKFPDVQTLAQAKIEDVLDSWSGLGYYSRARNLHESAKILTKTGFPKTAEKLIQLPGFGPYTSRAVASIVFDEGVGVLDGNVIRVLCRRFGLNVKWWNSKEKQLLQNMSDEFAKIGNSGDINQALMELGATVCTPAKPNCVLCPWRSHCVGLAKKEIASLPLKKPRRKVEHWVWRPQIFLKQNQIALVTNESAPFLKQTLILPGNFSLEQSKPPNFNAKHSITHHAIYVIHEAKHKRSPSKADLKDIQWVPLEKVSQYNPSSLIKKAIQSYLDQ